MVHAVGDGEAAVPAAGDDGGGRAAGDGALAELGRPHRRRRPGADRNATSRWGQSSAIRSGVETCEKSYERRVPERRRPAKPSMPPHSPAPCTHARRPRSASAAAVGRKRPLVPSTSLSKTRSPSSVSRIVVMPVAPSGDLDVGRVDAARPGGGEHRPPGVVAADGARVGDVVARVAQADRDVERVAAHEPQVERRQVVVEAVVAHGRDGLHGQPAPRQHLVAHQRALVEIVDAADQGGVDDEPLQRDLEHERLQQRVHVGVVVGVEDAHAGAVLAARRGRSAR